MAETTTTTPKVTTMGSPMPASVNDIHAPSEGGSASTDNTNSGQQGAGAAGDAGAAGAGAAGDGGQGSGQQGADGGQGQGGATAPELTREQIKQFFNFDGTAEELKAHLEKKSTPTTPTEPTKEEKEKAAAEFEQRVLSEYLAHGGKVEDYVALKQIIEADLGEFSVSQLKNELKEKGFNDDQIKEIIHERYYQFSDEEIEELSDADQKAIAKLKKEYGTDKLKNRSSYLKKQAEDTLKGLRDSVSAKDLLAKKETEFSSKVDESLKTLPRKLTFELGEVEGQPIPSVEVDVNETDIQEIADILKDPAKRQQFFYNEDNSLNIDNVGKVMLRNRVLEAAAKAMYFTGGKRQIEEFKKVFPDNPHEVGVGGRQSSASKSGGSKIVSKGEPQVARPQTK